MATPMSPSQWLTKLRAEGVKVTGYGTWETHERDDETGRTFGPVNGVTIHHTAGRDSKSLCYHGTSSLPGPLCHSYLPKTGTVYMMSAGRANHAGSFAQNAHNAVVAESSVHPYPDAAEPVDGNDKYYGIEIENLGNGTDPYTWAQYVAAVKWATAICRHHGWTEHSVIGHKEGTRRKIDPKGPVTTPNGPDFDLTMNRFRADVKAALALPAGAWQGAATKEEWEMADFRTELIAALKVDEVQDLLVKAVWQEDGYIGAPDTAADKATNPTWRADSWLKDTGNRVRSLTGEVAEIKAKVDSLSTGGVDLDLLAEKVADVLYKRLQS